MNAAQVYNTTDAYPPEGRALHLALPPVGNLLPHEGLVLLQPAVQRARVVRLILNIPTYMMR